MVYLAEQTRPRRRVALKVLRAGTLVGLPWRDRFQAESDVIARLQHPHIVTIHDVGEHEGQPFFTMEFVDGGSLAQKLAVAPLAHGAAARLVETLARAVHFAHQRGIVHRDLKPANVLLTATAAPKVADFGLAKAIADPAGPTETGAVLGTPAYMAPEQAGGRRRGRPGCRRVRAGAILYECLTGRPPFRAATPLETLDQVRNQEPVPPDRLQPDCRATWKRSA